MDLIIKPTEACNYRCTFCSSTNITEDKTNILSLDYIFDFLKRYPETNTIIVNGGEPLIMSPDYYWSILDHIRDNGLSTSISFTSNLEVFFKNPEPWVGLFKQEEVGVNTSFQYGNGRLKGNGLPLTEEEFIERVEFFHDHIGYRPNFIAVITEENKDTGVKTVELAKRLGVECKINYAFDSGDIIVKSGIEMGGINKGFSLGDIYGIYADIIKAGLGAYEYSCTELLNNLKGKPTTCPLNRDCDKGIRALQPSGDYYSCGAFGDDKEYPIDFKYEMSGGKALPLSTDPTLLAHKEECLTCPNFSLCNGCRRNIVQVRRGGYLESDCRKMKELIPFFEELKNDASRFIR